MSVPSAPAHCVHELFERQVAGAPDAVAVVCGAERVSYAQLDDRADRLARRLTGAGVRRGALVGAYLPRGIDLVVAVLAVLKAGAGYLVLDPELPVERLRGMAADARLAAVVTSGEAEATRLGAAAAFVASRPGEGPTLPRGAGRARPEDVACIMFTSGSTGRPKGVAAPHRAIVGTLAGQDYLPFRPGAVWLQAAPVSWDAFALELWGALLFGGTCVLHPGRPDPVVTARLVVEHHVEAMYLSASLFNVVVDEYPAALAGVGDLVVGGEALSPPHVRRAIERFPALRIRNGYGPVECMVFVTTHPVTADDAAGRSIPIGRPLAGKRVHVLDERLRPVPDGAVGELYAAGAGLAHGYLADPAATAERFVANPYGPPGDRLYRTGDLVRRHASGVLDYVGRADAQVKIRGFRVEPAEVEAVLAARHGVRQAAVVAGSDHRGDRCLVAYLVPDEDGPLPPDEQLRTSAAALLPDHMVPSAFIALDALPRTATGKLDRAALPVPNLAGPAVRAASRPPRTAAEKQVCALFAEVLGVDGVGVDDDFFELGGDSLRVARLIGRIAATFDADVGVRAVFETPTAAGLARRLATAATTPAATHGVDSLAQGADASEQASDATGSGEDPTARGGDRGRSGGDAIGQGGDHTGAGSDATGAGGDRVRLGAAESAVSGRPRISPAQRGIWFLDQLGAGLAYTMPILFRFRGVVDPATLRAALADVVRRHDALRTLFVAEDGEPVPRLPADGEVRPVLEIVEVTPDDLQERIDAAARYRFDLSRELPVRLSLFTDVTDPDAHAVLLVMHHIAVDGWSLPPLVRDLSAAYAARLAGRVPDLPPLPAGYHELTGRHRARLGDPADPEGLAGRQLRYWREALRGLPDRVPLPRRSTVPATSIGPATPTGPATSVTSAGSDAAGLVVRRVDAAGHAALLALARGHGATLFMVLHAALAAAIERAGAGTDVPIGAPVAGRASAGADDVVGYFVNLLVLRTDLAGDPRLGELLDRVRDIDLAAFAHQDVPFEQVVDDLNPARVPGRHPLTDVVLALQNNTRARLSLPGVDAPMEVVRTGSARFELLLDVTDRYTPAGAPAGVALTVEYRLAAFRRELMEWLADALVSILATAATDPDRRLSQLAVPAPSTGHPGAAAKDATGGVPAGPGAAAVDRSGGGGDDDLERRLAGVWAEVLGVTRVAPGDNFFALGGNSLSAVRLAARITTRERLPVTAAQVFAAPTVAQLAALIARGTAAPEIPIPRRERVPRRRPAGAPGEV